MPGTRKLGRTTDIRQAMLKNMVTYLIQNGKIETTVTRAKEVAAMTEKMITIAKNPTLANKRRILAYVMNEDVMTKLKNEKKTLPKKDNIPIKNEYAANKLINEIAPKYADKNGGYTRIYKTGPRRGDAAEMAIIELV